jgi:hypothetical protein
MVYRQQKPSLTRQLEHRAHPCEWSASKTLAEKARNRAVNFGFTVNARGAKGGTSLSYHVTLSARCLNRWSNLSPAKSETGRARRETTAQLKVAKDGMHRCHEMMGFSAELVTSYSWGLILCYKMVASHEKICCPLENEVAVSSLPTYLVWYSLWAMCV